MRDLTIVVERRHRTELYDPERLLIETVATL
jgi:hypothetical protein